MKAPIYLVSNNTVAYKSGDYIIVDRAGSKIPLPPESVSYVVKYGNSRLSEATLNFLADKGVPVFRFSYGNRYAGVFLPPETNIGKGREVQYRAYFNISRRLQLVRVLLCCAARQKIVVLRQYSYSNKIEKECKENSITFIKKQIIKIEEESDIDTLRGLEGSIAHAYFSALRCVIKYFKFEKREYNPPKDEVNTLLSFAYSLLYSEILHKVYEHGLCPFRGYLHEQNNQAHPLVYDLSEMFKPQIDRFVVKIINLNQLKDFHFAKKPDGNCLLSTQGKAFFLAEWMKFLRGTKLSDERKRPVSFSETIRQQVILFRQSLEKDEVYLGYNP